jgi:cytochrome c-type biogenesis protein CcmH
MRSGAVMGKLNGRSLFMAALAWAAVLSITSAVAKEAIEVGENPAVEKHMMELADELRCLQCQNQTLAVSNAPLAVDLRQQIRELIGKGQTDEQIKQYLVARYGDFVLYRPPVKAATWLLWFGPAMLMLAGLASLYLVLRRRNRLADPEPISTDQEALARRLLGGEDSESNSEKAGRGA